MNSAWPLVPLGNLLKCVQRRETVEPTKTYDVLGAHWYAKGLYIKYRKPGSQIRAQYIYRVEQGDFVYNRLFGWKGSFALATEANAGCYVSNEFPCCTIDKERLDGCYLWYYFSRPVAWNEALGLSSGGTPTSRNRLKEGKFLAMKIPLPSLAEQRRIVARIEELAVKVEAAQALRQQAVEGVQNLVVSIHREFSQSRIVRLGDILALNEEKEDVLYGRQYPQVGIKSFGKGLFAKEALDASQTSYKTFNRLYEGAVVLSQVKGWEGAIAVCGPGLAGFYASPEYRTFRCVPQMALPEYLAELVVTSWFYNRLDDATHGVGARRQRTRPELFLELELPMPKIEDQQKAVSIFGRLKATQQLQSATVAQLDALLPSILDRAFKGEL